MLTLQHRKLHSNTELPASECYTQTLNDQPLNVGTQNLICKFDLCEIQKISCTSPTPTTFKNLLKLWSLVEDLFLVFSRNYNINKVFIHHHFALQMIWVNVFQFQVKLYFCIMGNRIVAIQIQIYSLFVLHFNTKMKVIPKYACNTPTSYMRCCSLFAPNNKNRKNWAW